MHRDMPATTPVDFDPFADTHNAYSLPLTEPLREMWTAAQMGDEASCSYNQSFVLTLRGALSVESMESALRQTIERHDALRLSIDQDGERQHIAGTVSVALPVIDLSHLPQEAQRKEIDKMLHAEAAKPFDLAVAPLLRAKLVRESEQSHRLIVTIHHIVCDGWASAVVLSDLARLYAADRYGLSAQLPAAASYREYVTRETARSADPASRADEDYWVRQFTDSIPVLDLPADRRRPPTKTYNGALQVLQLDESLCRAVKATGARYGCTLFVTLLAAFEALLTRLSGQDDFVLGIPMAGQNLLENGQLVGHCVNMIPLRCKVQEDSSFADHLRRVRGTFLEAQVHQQLTFGSLLRRLNVPRDPGRTPLVAVTFNIDRIGAPFDFGALELAGVETAAKRYVNFEFAINIVDNGRDLVVECEYNTDLYERATVARWLNHYKVLLGSAAANPEQRMDEAPLLTEQERDKLVFGWNATDVPLPGDTLLHELFESQADRTPDATAVLMDDQRLTYRELDARANRLAHWLQKNGIAPDSAVPICVERSIDMVIGFLGILKAGGAYVPIDPDLPAQRIDYMLEEINSPVLLTQHPVAARCSFNAARLVHLDSDWSAISKEPDTRPAKRALSENIAYVIYTSGSTGRPKGVLVPHAAICNHMHWMQRAFPLGPADAVLQKTASAFDASVWEFFAPLMAGARLVMARPGGHADPGYLAAAILDHGVTRLQLVPSQLRVMLEEPAFWRCAPPLKDVFCGGEPLTKELCVEFYRRLPHATLHNLYGPTEAAIDTTAWTCPRTDMPDAIPIGRPIDNARLYIVNRRMQIAPVGVAGEILIGGAGLARGYFGRPDLTAEKFLPDPFRPAEGARVYRTGDVARYLADGSIDYLGRNDQQVKIRGYRIELGEIEACLLQHPDMRHAAVIAREERTGDKRLVAYFVSENQSSDFADQLRSWLRTTMPEYMVPAHFIRLAKLPLTHTGKLDRKALPPPDVIPNATRPAPVAPRSAPEELVAGVFRDVLARKDIGVFDNFFDLGGDSLMAARLMARLRAASGLDLPLRNLFERPTVAQLAEAVDALSWVSVSNTPARHAGDREQIEL